MSEEITVSELKNLSSLIPNLSQNIQGLTTIMASLAGKIAEVNTAAGKGGIKKIKEEADEATKSTGEFANILGDFSSKGGAAFDSIIQKYEKLGDKYKDLKEVLEFFKEKTIGDPFGAASVVAAATGAMQMSESFKSLTKDAQSFTANIGDISSRLAKVKGFDFLAPLARLANVTQDMINMENAFLKSAASGGNLKDVLGEVGTNLDRLDDKMIQYINETKNIGNATGLTSEQIKKYHGAMQAIPGMLTQTVTSTAAGGAEMHVLTAAVQVSRGAFIDYEEVLKMMQDRYMKFRTSGQDALEMIAKMSETANALQIPIQEMQRYVGEAAKNFVYLGDNSQSAISILEGFSPALEASGLGPEAITGLVSKFVGGIERLGMAQKAFIGAQTGGTGGLSEAFKIDLAIQEGNLDKVASQVQEALEKQIGGEIVTLEQAAGDERAAAQMAKQVQLLTSGPLKMVDTAAEAYRLLGAFTGKGEAGIKPEDALKNVVERGNNARDRQTTIITQIHNEVTAIKEKMGVRVSGTARDVNKTVTDVVNKPLETPILGSYEHFSTQAAQSKIYGREGMMDPTTMSKDAKSTLAEFITQIKSGFTSWKKPVKEGETGSSEKDMAAEKDIAATMGVSTIGSEKPGSMGVSTIGSEKPGSLMRSVPKTPTENMENELLSMLRGTRVTAVGGEMRRPMAVERAALATEKPIQIDLDVMCKNCGTEIKKELIAAMVTMEGNRGQPVSQ